MLLEINKIEPPRINTDDENDPVALQIFSGKIVKCIPLKEDPSDELDCLHDKISLVFDLM